MKKACVTLMSLALMTLLPVAGWAQPTAAPAKLPTFDVVSIRENKGDTTNRGYGATENGYHLRATSLLLLVVTAFVPSDGKAGLFNPDQIEGMPDWLTRAQYDIEAKVSDDDRAAWKQPEIQQAMLQQLLTERFKLVTHRESKEKSVFDLVLMKGGPKFKASETTDPDKIQQQHPGAVALPGGVMQVRGPKPQQNSLFGTTMADLAIFLGKGMGRPIVDKTGLAGRYDVSLELDLSPGPDGVRPDPMSVIFTALQEQLGLKLEPAKENIEMLVIDHIERPSEN